MGRLCHCKIAWRHEVLHLVAILVKGFLVKVDGIDGPGDDLADQPGDHQAGDESELVGHFEDDQDGGHRGLTAAPRQALMPPTASRT